MKAQCDEHGCRKLLCGCLTEILEDDGPFSGVVGEKNKWINELLKENGDLRIKLGMSEYEMKEENGL